jgi:hypothetical protein
LLLAALPLAAATLIYKEEQAYGQWWQDLYAAAPAPVWAYVERITAESQADPSFVPHDGKWCELHHPVWWDVVEALHRAFHNDLEMDARLRAVQDALRQCPPEHMHAAERELLDA